MIEELDGLAPEWDNEDCDEIERAIEEELGE